jgi:hypothetical protein
MMDLLINFCNHFGYNFIISQVKNFTPYEFNFNLPLQPEIITIKNT